MPTGVYATGVYASVADFAASSIGLRLVWGEDLTLTPAPLTVREFTQLIRGCEPGIAEALLEPRFMVREILRRAQITGATRYDYAAQVLRSLLDEPADHLAWRLLLRWASVTIVDGHGAVVGYAGALS